MVKFIGQHILHTKSERMQYLMRVLAICYLPGSGAAEHTHSKDDLRQIISCIKEGKRFEMHDCALIKNRNMTRRWQKDKNYLFRNNYSWTSTWTCRPENYSSRIVRYAVGALA